MSESWTVAVPSPTGSRVFLRPNSSQGNRSTPLLQFGFTRPAERRGFLSRTGPECVENEKPSAFRERSSRPGQVKPNCNNNCRTQDPTRIVRRCSFKFDGPPRADICKGMKEVRLVQLHLHAQCLCIPPISCHRAKHRTVGPQLEAP
jgi:hypothetical protein